jgi:hypothetical protein
MFSTATKSGRLRVTAAAVLLAGALVAAGWYAYKLHHPADDLDALLPRYERDMRHEIGVQQGTLGIVLLEWQQTFAEPGVQALMILVAAALFAAGFFRAAWVIDDDERERREARGSGNPGAG